MGGDDDTTSPSSHYTLLVSALPMTEFMNKSVTAEHTGRRREQNAVVNMFKVCRAEFEIEGNQLS